jgi:addiction module HigA family antidote
MSIRINDQWRICFQWFQGDAHNVEIVDYLTLKDSKTMDMDMAQLRNPHPGEILKEEFLNEIGISQNQLAHAIGVPGNRIHAIVNGTRAITGDTDLRLCKFFGLSEGYFLRLQNAYDTLEAKRRIAAQLAKIKPYKRDKAA